MLSIDKFLREPHIYHFEAAPVLDPAQLPPPGPQTFPLVLEYQARHAVLSGYAVGRLLGLNPDDAEQVRALDAVIGYFKGPVSQTPALIDSVRTRVIDALDEGSWSTFMHNEDRRAKQLGLKPPSLEVQPQLSRPWVESMLVVAQKKLAVAKRTA